MKAFLKLCAKIFAYTLAFIIIACGLLISTSHVFAPLLNKHIPDFEKWASDLLAMPVTIQKANITWYHYEPAISLDKVTVLNKTSHEPILEIKRVHIFFSIAKSIWHRQFIPDGVMMSGVDIDAEENAAGEIKIEGFPSFKGLNAKPVDDNTKLTDVVGWISTQAHLTLRDADIHYKNRNGIVRFITLYNLSFKNEDNRHLILGKAILHQDIPTEVNMAIQWIGTPVDLNKIKAKIYLYVSGFSISQWMKDFTWRDWQVKQGVLSAKLWATWNQGVFHKIQSTFELYNVQLYSQIDKSIHKVNRLSGNVGWKQNKENIIIAGNDLLIDLPTRLWPITNFYVALTRDQNNILHPKTINLGYINLEDVKDFVFASPAFLPDNIRNVLAGLQLKGGLENTAIAFPAGWTTWQQITWTSHFNKISNAAWQNYPGLSNLTGEISWDGLNGKLILNSNQLEFAYAKLFKLPFTLDQVTGHVNFQIDKENKWLINISNLQLLNSDAAANVSGTVSPTATDLPAIDLKANFVVPKVQHIVRYLPMNVFEPNLRTWLSEAFLSGEVSSGTAILKGNLKDFPFTEKNGEFNITGTVNNVNLRYAPDWPILQHVNGKLIFTGRKMLVEANQVETLGMALGQVRAIIPNLGDKAPQILEIESNSIASDFTQGMRFIHKSPLEKTIGKMFKDVQITGPLNLKLGLKIPLSNPDDTKVDGTITFTEAQMNLIPWHLNINNLQGQLHFNEDTTDAKNIQGQLFNKPLVFDLTTLQNNKNVSIVRASFKNNLNIKDLEAWLKIPFTQVANGQAKIAADIDFSAKSETVIHLRSDLVGVSLSLPDEYKKNPEEARDFSADIFIAENSPLRMQISYGKLLNAALVLNRKQSQFNLVSANIHLGAGSASWPAGPGLYITGNFPELNWEKIKLYFNESSNKNTLSTLPLRGIDVYINNLRLPGMDLSKMRLQLTPSSDTWTINMASPDIIGQLTVPTHFNAKGNITADFQKLNLHSKEKATRDKNVIDVNSIPAISFNAQNISYNGMYLGRLNFKTVPISGGLSIRIVELTSPNIYLSASGSWSQSNMTHLKGNAYSENVSNFINSLGLDAHNFISSKGKLDFDLNWHAAPFSPELASLSGEARIDIGRGRVVDIGAANEAKMDIGKMLSIFSLQNIPRRLTFDFSDVFQKGYSFDYIRGDFNFKNGSAYTSNLQFNGPVAKINIDGRIGLKNQDYDFTLSVTPYVSSSLPIAAALIATPPIVGLAAMAVNTVISAGVSKASTYFYAVKGPWANPTWQSVNVSGRSQSQQPQQNR